MISNSRHLYPHDRRPKTSLEVKRVSYRYLIRATLFS